jgi:hypothetical protein
MAGAEKKVDDQLVPDEDLRVLGWNQEEKAEGEEGEEEEEDEEEEEEVPAP